MKDRRTGEGQETVLEGQEIAWVRVRDITKGHVRVMVRVRERSLTINLFFIAVF